MSDPSLDELRKQSASGDRLDEAPKEQRQVDLKDSMREHLQEINDGDRQKTVSVWDGPLAAFVAALEDNPDELREVGENLREALEIEASGEPDRSEILRLALRLGFREAAPDHVETLREAVRDEAASTI